MNDQLKKAMDVAEAVEWEGDPRVNFTTAVNAAKTLARELRDRDAEIAARPRRITNDAR